MSLDLLLRILWHRRWAMLLASLLLFAAATAGILALPRSYVAEAVVAPAETTSIATSTLLSPVPILGGSLLDNRPGGNFAIYLDALRSAEAAQMLAKETGLLAYLTELRGNGLMGPVRRAFDLRIEADLDDVRNWLDEQLAVTPGIATVTVTLALAHRDRDAALDALRRLHRLAEAKVRADIAEMARRRIAAIDARLMIERDLFLRNTLFDLMAQQQRTALIVAADDAVAARVVSAPMVEVRPSLPNRPLLIALLAVVVPMLVLFLTTALVLVQGARAARSPPPYGYQVPLRSQPAGGD
jgi:uncharacterized protein involved in exopolysaccharide biosynthesis